MGLRFCILCALAVSTAAAQPEWVATAMQETHSSLIHKDAVTITLLDDVVITFDADGRASSKYRIVYRILRPAGVDAGTVTIPTSPNRVLRRIRGWRFADGKEKEKVDDDNIVVVNPGVSAGYYTDARRAMVGFSDAQPDDIVAFEYDLEETGPTARYQSNSFQGRQPVARSTFSITIPPGWSLRTAGRRMEPVQQKTMGNTTVWSASDLPYEPAEPLTPPYQRPGRWVRVVALGGEAIADWNQVARWELSRTEPAAATDGAVSSLASTLTSTKESPWNKFVAAAKFVQQEIRYVALELGEGGWTPRPAGETLRNRFGDCKDKTTLLRSILRSAGIPSSAVLASSSSGVSPDLPTPYQFNHVIVAIPDSALGKGGRNAVADGWFFFDPTDPDVPPGKIPPGLEGSRVFLVEKDSARLVTLPGTDASANVISVDADGTVAPDGLLSTSVRMLFRGRTAYALRGSLRSTTDMMPLWLSYVRDAVPDATVKNVTIADSTDSIAVTFSLEGRGLLSNAGVEGLLRMNFLELRTPDRLTTRTRVHPLWLGPSSSERVRIRWKYPGYLLGPDTLIQHSSTCRGNSFTTAVRSYGKGSEFNHTAIRSNDVIPASEYGSVRTYISELERTATTAIQLRKTLQ
jgi:transglutaminase-like putative cysteine protease